MKYKPGDEILIYSFEFLSYKFGVKNNCIYINNKVISKKMIEELNKFKRKVTIDSITENNELWVRTPDGEFFSEPIAKELIVGYYFENGDIVEVEIEDGIQTAKFVDYEFNFCPPNIINIKYLVDMGIESKTVSKINPLILNISISDIAEIYNVKPKNIRIKI